MELDSASQSSVGRAEHRDRRAWVLQACRSGHLSRHEKQVMLRVAHEDIQLDAHEIALFKAGLPASGRPFIAQSE